MLSAWTFASDVIVMTRGNGTSLNRSSWSPPEALRRYSVLIGIVLVLGPIACSPVVFDGTGGSASPIDVLDKSPRIYQVGFRAIADSVETARASTYLQRNLDYAALPGPKVLAAVGDSVRARSLSSREAAQLEYYKARRRLDVGAEQAAAYHLKRAMAADATYRPPYLLLGEMLLGRGAFEQAFDLYSKVLTWDSADSDALVGLASCRLRMGNVVEARQALVDAVIFDRLNLKAWSNLHLVAAIQNLSIANHDAPDLGLVKKLRGRHLMIAVDASLKDCPVQAAAWITYASERAVWRYEGKYMKRFGPGRYQSTFEEDIDCYMVLAAAWKTLARQDSTGCDAAYLDYLSKVADDGYLVSHVLFDYVCLETPQAARYFSVEVLARLRDYVNTYVIVSDG